MSDFFLCDYCDNQHAKGNTYEWQEMCDEPTKVCEHYVARRK